jgi:hypothetical protein
VTPKRIQRRRTKGWRMPENAVYVGRPTRWGNPFKVGDPIPEPWSLTATYAGRVVEDRRMAVDLFESYAEVTPFYAELVRDELAGHDLACFCPLDEPCHADVLLRIANEEPK